MANPFRFGAPVTGEQFTGRRSELTTIVRLARDHVNVVVISPRRFGKTSLLNEACARVRKGGGNVAEVNAMTVNDDLGVFASRLVSAVYAGKGPWHRAKESVADFLARLNLQPQVTFGSSGPSFSISAEVVQRDPVGVIGKTYGLMAETRTPLVFIDEFQELTRLPGNLPGLFKGLADQYPDVALVIAGSKPHMMQELTADSRGPLYGMMQTVQLGPIPADQMGDFVQRRFNIGGRPIDRDLADRIVELAGPVPNDIQHLAYEVFTNAAADRDVREADIAEGMRAATDHQASIFADTYSGLTTGQRRVLTALARRPDLNPQSGEFLTLSGYANPSGVKRALTSLEAIGVTAVWDGRWVIISPYLRRWLASQ